MTELSPSIQAVLDASYEAWYTKDDPRSIAAAVLRAAAEFVDSGDASEQLIYWATELMEDVTL